MTNASPELSATPATTHALRTVNRPSPRGSPTAADSVEAAPAHRPTAGLPPTPTRASLPGVTYRDTQSDDTTLHSHKTRQPMTPSRHALAHLSATMKPDLCMPAEGAELRSEEHTSELQSRENLV